MWSDLTLSPSFKVKQGQPNLKGFITCLLLILEVCNVKPTCRILWAGNILMPDLTFGPSFKVKRWFDGFTLSFQWIQICIGSPMCRSSLTYKSYKMVDNKSKTYLKKKEKNISLMKTNNIILVLHTVIILSSFVIYFLVYVIRVFFPF